MRRSYLKHLLRGELQATAHTSWWYHSSGANKLAARTLASRKRYKVSVRDLSPFVRSRLHLKRHEKVGFHRIVSAVPSAKVGTLAEVEDHVRFLLDTHKVRSNFVYRKCHVR